MSAKEKKPSTRRRKLEHGVARGLTPPNAAREAGFSEGYARSDVYKVLANPSVQERIEKRRVELAKRADIKREEVLGALAQIATSSLADVLPDNEFLQQAKELGTDHLIKKVRKIRHKDGSETLEFEMYNRLDALNQLSDNMGLKKQAAVNPSDLEEAKRILDWHRKRSTDFTEVQIYTLLIQPHFPAITAEQLQIKEEVSIGSKGDEGIEPVV